MAEQDRHPRAAQQSMGDRAKDEVVDARMPEGAGDDQVGPKIEGVVGQVDDVVADDQLQRNGVAAMKAGRCC